MENLNQIQKIKAAKRAYLYPLPNPHRFSFTVKRIWKAFSFTVTDFFEFYGEICERFYKWTRRQIF